MNFKSVILFRSKKIEESKKDYQDFLEWMENLASKDFDFLKNIGDKIFHKKYKLSPDIVKDLQLKGHSLESKKYLGKLMGITFNPFEKIYVGVSDSSSPDGAAVGY